MERTTAAILIWAILATAGSAGRGKTPFDRGVSDHVRPATARWDEVKSARAAALAEAQVLERQWMNQRQGQVVSFADMPAYRRQVEDEYGQKYDDILERLGRALEALPESVRR